jgi:hypothetical protein
VHRNLITPELKTAIEAYDEKLTVNGLQPSPFNVLIKLNFKIKKNQ